MVSDLTESMVDGAVFEAKLTGARDAASLQLALAVPTPSATGGVASMSSSSQSTSSTSKASSRFCEGGGSVGAKVVGAVRSVSGASGSCGADWGRAWGWPPARSGVCQPPLSCNRHNTVLFFL